MIDLSDQKSTGVQNCIESSIRTSEEGSLHELSYSIIDKVNL